MVSHGERNFTKRADVLGATTANRALRKERAAERPRASTARLE